MKISTSTLTNLCNAVMDIALAANKNVAEEQLPTIEEYVANTVNGYLDIWENATGEQWEIIDDEENSKAVDNEEPDYFEKAVADIERLRAALAPTLEDDLVINKLKANLHGEKPSAPPSAVHDCLLRTFAALADYES